MYQWQIRLKKVLNVLQDFFHAGGRTRTGTAVKPLDFESSASANSATPAKSQNRYLVYHKYSGIASVFCVFSLLYTRTEIGYTEGERKTKEKTAGDHDGL